VNVSERLTLEDVRSARERIRSRGRPVVAVITGGNIDAGVLARLLSARS